RLYPTGETEISRVNINRSNKLYKANANSKFKDWYEYVLRNSFDDEESQALIYSKERVGSNGLFLPLKNASEKTQSVGQDNLGSIISALVEFYIKEFEDEEYSGGI